MIIDSHHHLWNYNPLDYGWMGDSMQVLKRDYLPPDLKPVLKDAGVDGTVVVQARQTLEETEWLLDLAGTNDFIYGVVGWVDLCSPDLAQQLDKFAKHPKLVGVRHVIHDEPDDDFMLREEFKVGIGQLEDYGLVYDLLLFPLHLRRAAELVRIFPGQRFVLDHLGKPPIKDGEIKSWQKDLENLAQFSNVYCKLSGMVTEADWFSWEQEDFVPYMSVLLDAFGPDRIMLGSDWPVCTLAGDYGKVMLIPGEFISKLSTKDQELIQYRTAIECYQLKLLNNGEEEVQST
jgi:L-fuconolactonase